MARIERGRPHLDKPSCQSDTRGRKEPDKRANAQTHHPTANATDRNPERKHEIGTSARSANARDRRARNMPMRRIPKSEPIRGRKLRRNDDARTAPIRWKYAIPNSRNIYAIQNRRPEMGVRSIQRADILKVYSESVYSAISSVLRTFNDGVATSERPKRP